MSATATKCKPGQRVELGRYEIPGEQRVLVGRRVEGKVCVYDYPLGRQGRRYFVERGFDSKAELALLVADYRRQAERLGACPMSREAIAAAFALDPTEPRAPQLRTP